MIEQLVNKLLNSLNSRQREVLEKRFGLKDGKEITLEAIGKIHGITRERVRQIEAAALNNLGELIKKGILDGFSTKVLNHLKNIGGVRRETLLLADLQVLLGESASIIFDNRIKFLLSLSDPVKYSPEDKNFYSYWYLDKQSRKKALDCCGKLKKFLAAKKKDIISLGSIEKVFKMAIKPQGLKDLVVLNYISISKDFHVNQHGEFGLSKWLEINPRTIRDWAHLILRKAKKPMHFTEITREISKIRDAANKITNVQTVHNELIKDQRFVLVGRGIYGLEESGLMPGTTKVVLKNLLEKHGPLTSDELLKLILKERMLKKSTIFVNLQNRKHFKRLDDGRYTINTV